MPLQNPYRRFSSELEKLAQDWVAVASVGINWKELGAFGGTESQPFKVQSGNLLGLGKPGVVKNDGIARAAHEKIASDLAFHLGLPIPPVTLFDRGVACAGERYVCVSAWAFEQPFTWDQAQGKFTPAHRAEAGPIVAAMLAFETWISAEDRKSDHVLVQVTDGAPIQLAFIDYAYSLSKAWPDSNTQVGAAHQYMPVPRDDTFVCIVADRIARFDEQLIRELISRIPTNYLTDQKKRIIIGNLTARAKRIHELLGLR